MRDSLRNGVWNWQGRLNGGSRGCGYVVNTNFFQRKGFVNVLNMQKLASVASLSNESAKQRQLSTA
jgi:hypothetical protein